MCWLAYTIGKCRTLRHLNGQLSAMTLERMSEALPFQFRKVRQYGFRTTSLRLWKGSLDNLVPIYSDQ